MIKHRNTGSQISVTTAAIAWPRTSLPYIKCNTLLPFKRVSLWNRPTLNVHGVRQQEEEDQYRNSIES